MNEKIIITIPYAIKLTLLNIVAPIVLTGPLLIAQMAGWPLARQIGLTSSNFFPIFITAQALWTTVILIITHKRLKDNGVGWSYMGFRSFSVKKASVYFIMYYLTMTAFLVVVAITSILLGAHGSGDMSNRTGSLSDSFWLLFVVSVILVPVTEEIFFRGLLFNTLMKKYRFTIAASVSTLFFALSHINPIQIIGVLPLGFYTCFMYKNLGSIYPGIILHASWNLLVLLLFTK